MGTQNNTAIYSKLENYLVYQLLQSPDVEISKQSIIMAYSVQTLSSRSLKEGFFILIIVILQIKL